MNRFPAAWFLLAFTVAAPAPAQLDAAATAGDAKRGARVIAERHCGACHVIPGIRRAGGHVGPPLTQFARRTFIAGQLANSRENLVRWVLDPQSVEPGTAMPTLGLSRREARDVAAYLHTLR